MLLLELVAWLTRLLLIGLPTIAILYIEYERPHALSWLEHPSLNGKVAHRIKPKLIIVSMLLVPVITGVMRAYCAAYEWPETKVVRAGFRTLSTLIKCLQVLLVLNSVRSYVEIEET